MKMFRARLCVLLWMACAAGLALGPVALCGWAEKVAAMPAPSGYVDDYAGVLSGSAKTELEALCSEVHDKTKAQVFFVTVKSLEGEDMESFANDLFHKWGVGEKKTDRGVLLVLAIKDHKRRIEVGYGFEGILPDAKAGDIGREMVPALQASNYDEAARIGVHDVARIIAADSNVTLTGLDPADEAPAGGSASPAEVTTIQRTSQSKWWLALFFVPLFGGFGLFAWLVVFNIRRGVRFGGGGIGGGSGSGGDSGSSFGGDSGGSSDSFSGGDGGDSGGGGAGGSW